MFDWSNYSPLGKATYRGGSGSKLHLSRDEAKQFLLHHPHGRALQRDFPNIPFDALAGHVCKASRKREVSTMDDHLNLILKSESAMHALCKHLAANGGTGFTHPEFDDFLGRYAAGKYPALRLGNAIAKVLAEETPVARAYQAVHSFYKAEPVADDEDDEDDDDDDALEELNRLAEAERRRENGMTKAAAFAKVYTDPANAKLAQRERAQNRPR
jgi:hypothetical protein